MALVALAENEKETKSLCTDVLITLGNTEHFNWQEQSSYLNNLRVHLNQHYTDNHIDIVIKQGIVPKLLQVLKSPETFPVEMQVLLLHLPPHLTINN